MNQQTLIQRIAALFVEAAAIEQASGGTLSISVKVAANAIDPEGADIRLVLVLVAKAYGITPEDIIGHSRNRICSEARAMAFAILHHELGYPPTLLCTSVFRRDRSTARHYLRLHADLTDTDRNYLNTCTRITEDLPTCAGLLD